MPEQEVSSATYEALSGSLGALASPARLALLHKLRTPTRVGSIKLRVPDEEGPAGATRLVSRQAVTWHLEQLLEAGLVSRLPAKGRGHRYVLDHQRLFAVLDEMHNLTTLRPVGTQGDPEGKTLDQATAQGLPTTGAPRLVLVYGRDDGTVFELEGPPGASWTIGRDAGCDLRLDYDPFASGEHAVVEQGADGLVLVDQGSSNGTFVNGHRLSPQDEHVLEAGDIVTVGRSRLVFQA